MKYLVICKDQSAFWTNWYTYDNIWNGETIHCVVDIAAGSTRTLLPFTRQRCGF